MNLAPGIRVHTHGHHITLHTRDLVVPGLTFTTSSWSFGSPFITLSASVCASSQRNGMCQFHFGTSSETVSQNSRMNSKKESMQMDARSSSSVHSTSSGRSEVNTSSLSVYESPCERGLCSVLNLDFPFLL